MYKLDNQALADLQALIGCRMERISFGPYSLHCTLTGGATLSCESAITLGDLYINIESGITSQAFERLHSALHGREVAAIAAGPDNDLLLTLDSGAVLTLDGSSEMYEAYKVAVGDTTVIV